MIRFWARAGAVAFLSGCSALGIGNGTALTPREQLDALEVSYTAAANSANQSIALIPTAARPQVAAAYKTAGDALNALDADVMALPAGSTGDASFGGLLATAQSALSALTTMLTQYGVK